MEKTLEQILDVLKDIARLQAMRTLETSSVPWNAVIAGLLGLILWRIW